MPINLDQAGIIITLENWQHSVDYLLERETRQHVDRVMYECEVALTLHCVPTRFSCCGHIDDLPHFPYIIVSEEASILIPEYLCIFSNEPPSEGAIKAEGAIMSAHAELGQSLLQLLDAFYRVRGTHEVGSRLVIQASGLCQYTLLNQGSIVGLHSNNGYVKEFVAFTTFLKDYLK